MDHIVPRDIDFEVDLEKGGTVSEENPSKSLNSAVKKQENTVVTMVYGRFADGSIKGDDRVSLCCNVSNSNGVSAENVNLITNKKLEGEKPKDDVKKNTEKDKRKKPSNKKPSKPPRPPRGPSFDAADQMLIREITELAMLKRARIERKRALKQMKGAKASSSNGNLFAIVFTILFCLVIIFQGMSSRRASGGFQGSPLSAGRTEGGLISVQYFGNPSASERNGPGSGLPNLVERVSGLDPQGKLRRVAG